MNSKLIDAELAHAAKTFLEKHYKEKISIQDLADKIGVGEKTLKRAFKNVYGKGIYECLLDLRMEKAVELLEENKPVKQVAGLVGYKRHSSFTKQFNKHFGKPPSDWEN